MTSNPIFEYELVILERHLDTLGHVNNSVYLEIFEEARWEAITRGGYGIKKIQETGMGPTILEFRLKFLKEIRLRQRIVVKTQLESYSGKIGVMKQWIENEKKELCCDAELKFGLFDVKERKLIPPTPDWLRAMTPS